MERVTLKEMHRRILRSFLDIAILAKLKRGGPMSGYDVIAFCHKKFGILLSSGTVYSVLYALERDGLVKGMWDRRKRVYKLTDKGEKTMKNILNLVGEIQSFIRILAGG